VTSTDVKEQSDVLPSQTRLLQNYPNPFNPSTNDPVRVGLRTRRAARVFDMLDASGGSRGREKGSGSYTMTFDAKQLPSGVYFARLQAGPSVANAAHAPVPDRSRCVIGGRVRCGAAPT